MGDELFRGIAIGIAVSIVMFVIFPGMAYLVWLRIRRPKTEPFDFVAYRESVRPLYTTQPQPLPKRPKQSQGELRWYDDTGILAVRDWGFAKDVYLEDGSVKMIETVSRQVYP